jgi:nucleoid-associated protein EbfC
VTDPDDGMLDVNSLLQQAMAMQQQLASAQAQAAATVVEGHSGGGLVRVSMTGGGEVTSIRIAPAAVDPDAVDVLEDLVLAALRDAANRASEVQSQAMGDLGALKGLLG